MFFFLKKEGVGGGGERKKHKHFPLFNLTARRKAKIVHNFDLPECNRVKMALIPELMSFQTPYLIHEVFFFKQCPEKMSQDTVWIGSSCNKHRDINNSIFTHICFLSCQLSLFRSESHSF